MKIHNDEFMLLLRGNLLVDSAQAQLCSACQSFAMAHISATIKFRLTVRNKQFEAKQTDWMLTRSITRALQTRIPILGSETRCARLYLAGLVTLGLVLVLRLAPRKRYLVMILKLDWERSQTLEVLSCSYPRASIEHQLLVIQLCALWWL